MTTPVLDHLSRPLGSLRLSLTDRCNMRCRYCMPEEEYLWLPRESILTFEEFDRLAGMFLGLGATKIRLTGGEPLLRQDLPSLVRMLSRQPELEDLAMTTNGILLADQAAALHEAGLHRVTVSLDTLRPERMLAYARSPKHPQVLEGITTAKKTGFRAVKLNSVIIRGFNDDEILDLLEYARAHEVELRFIEYMDVGGATKWSMADVVSRADLLRVIGERYGPVQPVAAVGWGAAPAERFLLPDGTQFGIIASTTAPFCRSCDRSRITADGTWYLCLYAEEGIDLRHFLRQGASDGELRALICETWAGRRDRGAEARHALVDRGVLYALEGLRADPRREMHTRGG